MDLTIFDTHIFINGISIILKLERTDIFIILWRYLEKSILSSKISGNMSQAARTTLIKADVQIKYWTFFKE